MRGRDSREESGGGLALSRLPLNQHRHGMRDPDGKRDGHGPLTPTHMDKGANRFVPCLLPPDVTAAMACLQIVSENQKPGRLVLDK